MEMEACFSMKYLVSRIKSDDTLFGPLHRSEDGFSTLCGKALNENWFIVDNDGFGEITCKECLKRSHRD